jgi:serine/threonine protein kinase
VPIARTYRIHEVVGRGSFGIVYRATMQGEGGFSKEVAVKMLNDAAATDAQQAMRLRDEARLLGLVRHRAILQVDGLVRLLGQWALVTEYVKGVNLLTLARTQPIPLSVALEVAGEVAGGLHVAFSTPGNDGGPLKLVHRDVKPANIQISSAGEVKLLDFGIARAEYGEREAETNQMLVGSLSYMSPERLDQIDGPEGDVYALGIVLCEVISQKRFGKTSSNADRHREHIDGGLAKVRERLGPDLEPVLPLLSSMLAYDPRARPTAKDVERECRRLRGVVNGPFLADWAEQHVRGAADVDMEPDELVGRVLGDGDQPVVVESVEPALVSRPPAAVWLLLALGLVISVLGITLATNQLSEPASGRVVDLPIAELAPPVIPPSTVPPMAPTVIPTVPSSPQTTTTPTTEPGVKPAVPEPSHPPGTSTDKPKAKVPSASAKAGRPVSAGDFANWLGTHPAWESGAAVAAGKADSNYLRGWNGNTAPDPSAPMTNVSWWAAQQFCASRGGLAGLDAGPTGWSESSGPFQEWRADGDQAAWRRFDGATSRAVRRVDANAFTGFRCAK